MTTLRNVSRSTAAEIAEAATARLASRIAAARADLRALEAAKRVYTVSPKAEAWANARNIAAKGAARHDADVARLTAEVDAAETVHRSWRDRVRALVPGLGGARRQRAAAIRTLHTQIAEHTQNAVAYRNAKAAFETSHTKAIQKHREEEDAAYDDDLALHRRYIADLEAAVTMIRVDPTRAVQARTDLVGTLAEWRAQRAEVEMEVETVVGFEPP